MPSLFDDLKVEKADDSLFPQQAEQPGLWDRASDMAMEALGGTQAIGEVAGGMLAWPVSKAAGGLVGPFVEGGPDMVEGFVGEMMQPMKPPQEGTPARAGYDLISQPVNKVMETAFLPATKVKEFVQEQTGSQGAAWSAGLIAELATFKVGHVAGAKAKAIVKSKQRTLIKNAKELTAEDWDAAGNPNAKVKKVDNALAGMADELRKLADTPETQRQLTYIEQRRATLADMNQATFGDDLSGNRGANL